MSTFDEMYDITTTIFTGTVSTPSVASTPTHGDFHRMPPPQGHPDFSWKAKRRKVTLFYGYVTFIITILFIIVLPCWNRVSNYIYYKFLQLSRWLRINPKVAVLHVNPMSAQMIIFWSIILSILSVCQSNWDIRFIAARLGRVPVYCLPTVLFLTLRPSPLSDVLYLQLLPIHKWLSRIVILQSLLHTLCYLYIMIEGGTLEKLNRFDNKNGVYAMIAFMVILITSLSYFRRAYYKFFFINHYICTWIVTITLYFHVRPGIPYLTALNCFILVYQIYYKFKISKISRVSIMKISDLMVVADMPNDAISAKYNLPGCHIRLIDYDENHSKFWNYLKMIFIPIQHPYTVASLPVDKSQKLIIRIGTYKLEDNHKYFITGAYLPHLSFIQKVSTANTNASNPFSMIHTPNVNNLNSLLVSTVVKKCLIVVGGSAISFALPILRVLNYNGAMVKIIWVIRDHEDLKVLDYFKNYLINDDCIDIFITGKYTSHEKESFKEALTELHKKKRELELQQETEILSGGYSYYNNNESDNSNNNSNSNSSDDDEHKSHHDEAVSLSSSNKSLDLKSNLDNDTETAPLIGSNLKKPSYGSSTLQPDFERLHRKSYIDFKNHNQKISTSYNDETIDIELHEADRYKKSMPLLRPNTVVTPSAGMGFSDHGNQFNIDNSSSIANINHSRFNTITNSIADTLSNNNSDINNNNSNLNNSSVRTNLARAISPDTGNKGVPTRHKARKSSSRTEIPSSITSPVNHKLMPGSASISASSALYDDLENYWVLKSSFSHIEFGRPKLGLHYYSWCIGSSCIGPLVNLQSGKSICYNIREDPSSAYNEQLNELYSNDTFMANRRARLEDRNGKPDESIWIIGAGPSGLVDNVRLWANDCGFSFHEESFIV